MDNRPSIKKIIIIDSIAFIAFLFPIIIWGMYIVLNIFDKPVEQSFLSLPIIFGAITIVAIIVVIWRILTISNLFSEGIEAMATLDQVFFFRDRGRLDYFYVFMGEKYRSSNAVQKCKYTKDIKVGSQTIVMVDRNHPGRALIRDLYM